MEIPQTVAPQVPSSIIDNYSGTRITRNSPRSFYEVTARLYRSIGHNPDWSSSSLTNSTTVDPVIVPPTSGWPGIMDRDNRLQHEGKTTKQRREIFREGVEAIVGPSGFMFFAEFNHGSWMQLFLPFSSNASGAEDNSERPKPRQCKRIILGNPLIAITMLQHDLNAGLAVPVELLLVEDDEEEVGLKKPRTRIVYQLPSALIAGVNTNPELREAAEKLDEKLEALVKDIAS